MPLTAGVQFGHYEIVARLGAGGMGEVYRARDPRLGREVALKILPAEFAKDLSRRARFAQEARAAAALNHPNIVALHDIGEDHDIAYIVSELVSGETLRSLIEHGPLPIRKLLDIAVQITDGMAAAHAAHITHRDLKPANIMVATDGRAKILDFGLARQGNVAISEFAETITQQTQPGMILGTASYMSPEQARGQVVDYRSDQFSFGLILYEMVTGKRAFDRAESVQTISAILTDEPPAIERAIPGPLRWVIERCLSKDPSDRYESTRDLYHELRELRDHLSDASTSQAALATATRRMRSWHIGSLSALALLVVFAGGWYLAPPSLPDQSAYRFTPFVFNLSSQARGAWSPDGKAVAYQERVRGKEQTFVRYLDSPLPVQVTNMSEPASPFGWTPDGQRILFYTDQKVPGVWSVAAAGGEPESMLSEDSKNFLYVASTHTASPDLTALAVVAAGPDGWWSVWTSAPPGSPLKKYYPDPFAARRYSNAPTLRFTPDGRHLLLSLPTERAPEDSWLLPYPPDPSKPPHRLRGKLPVQGATPQFSWMPDSRRIVVSTKAAIEGTYQLWMADSISGDYYALTSGTTHRMAPAVSPDGTRILFTDVVGSLAIASASLDTAAAELLIATGRNEQMPVWAANRQVLTYVSERNGPREIWTRSGEVDRPLVTGKDFPAGTTKWLWGPALSPDAQRVIYVRTDVKGAMHLWVSAISGGTPSLLTKESSYIELPGCWSPDGSWFAYLAVPGLKVDLMKVKTTGQATPILIQGGVSPGRGAPSWSPDGAWIAVGEQLVSPDGKMTRLLPKNNSPAYMFSANGKRVYGVREDGERQLLFFIELETGNEKVVGDLGKKFRPESSMNFAIRFSLSPDGKSFVFGVGDLQNNLWLLEGFEPKPSLLARLRLR